MSLGDESTRSSCPVDLTVLLPCAGAGRRFDAPYPKELHRSSDGFSLVDLALAPVLAVARAGVSVRLVVAVTPEKLDTARYLSRYADDFQLVFTYQRDHHGQDLSGAIRALVPFASGSVMLILPDQRFEWSETSNPVEQALNMLETFPWAVMAVRNHDDSVLRVEGALCLEQRQGVTRVLDAADKPEDTTGFNGVWAAIACREEEVSRMACITEGLHDNPLVGAGAIMVEGYHNTTRPSDERYG